tara:strand:+ start:1661 stop:3055 length:1395 start_codon:yes stop_codon:yes gene_type:complete
MIYKIIYNLLKGGNNNLTEFPDYPDNLKEIKLSKWPPELKSNINIKYDSFDFNGTVVEYIWNDTACIIKLDNETYTEPSLLSNTKFNNGKGYYLLLANHYWKYNLKNDIKKVDIIKSDKIIQKDLQQKEIKQSPLLSEKKNHYFSENKIDFILSDNDNVLTSLPKDKIELIRRKLIAFEKIDQKDIKTIVNKNIAVNNLIINNEDIINEGNKIITWIDKVLKKEVFKDLITHIHDDYIYITRKGTKIKDIITKDLVSNLKYFDWQYNNPIDYDTLKYVIYQNTFQKKLEENILQKKEAEEILSQEYVIALQPAPDYQMWTLKRLIMILYGDTAFESRIRKIKILINQFRADPNQEYNKKNGILPQILIYPKYGSENSRVVISKLEYYFSLYIDNIFNNNYLNIEWIDSNPTYFIKKNNLIYFSNGSIDLKKYIEDSIKSNNNIINDIFTEDYTKLINSDKIMSV